MNNIVRNQENKVLSADEIELTDVQLEGIFGAWYDGDGDDDVRRFRDDIRLREERRERHLLLRRFLHEDIDIRLDVDVREDRESRTRCGIL